MDIKKKQMGLLMKFTISYKEDFNSWENVNFTTWEYMVVEWKKSYVPLSSVAVRDKMLQRSKA